MARRGDSLRGDALRNSGRDRDSDRRDRDRDRERDRRRDRDPRAHGTSSLRRADRAPERLGERGPASRAGAAALPVASAATTDVATKPEKTEERKPFSSLKNTVLEGSGHERIEITDANFNGKGTRLAASKMDGSLLIWKIGKRGDQVSRHPTVIAKTHTKATHALAWKPNNDDVLATVGKDSSVLFWDAIKGQSSREVKTEEKSLYGIAFSGDSKYLAVCSSQDNVLIIDSSSGEIIQTVSYIGKGQVHSICWNNSSDALFVGLRSGAISLLMQNADGEFQEVHTLHGHRSTINSMCMDPKGEFLAVGSHEGVISIWSMTDLSVIKTIGSVDYSIYTVDVFSSGNYIGVTYVDADTARIYHVGSGEEVLQLTQCTPGVQLDPVFRFNPAISSYMFTSGDGSVYSGVPVHS